MLTREAWNAFLKTLEEPPPNTVFILATTEPHKVMPTIVDRCQRFDFQRPSLEQLAEVIDRVSTAEWIEIEPGAVAAVARAASGSFRDALGTLDQLVSYGGTEIATADVLAVLGVADAELILSAADAIAAGDGRAALEVTERLARSGHDVTQFARDLLAHLRQLIVVRTLGEPPDSFSVTAAEPERLRSQAESLVRSHAWPVGRCALQGAGGHSRGRRAADDGRIGAACGALGRSWMPAARLWRNGSSGWRLGLVSGAGAGDAVLGPGSGCGGCRLPRRLVGRRLGCPPRGPPPPPLRPRPRTKDDGIPGRRGCAMEVDLETVGAALARRRRAGAGGGVGVARADPGRGAAGRR